MGLRISGLKAVMGSQSASERYGKWYVEDLNLKSSINSIVTMNEEILMMVHSCFYFGTVF